MGRLSVVVRQVPVEEIFALRQAVLRPNRPASFSVYAQDPHAVHLAAYDGDLLVGCATTFAQAWPGDADPAAPAPQPAAWRLRGMAVDASRQGSGVGREVLAAVVDAARTADAPLLWADGRVSALGFYTRLGWQVVGEDYVVPDSGLPHRRIVLPLSGPGVGGAA